LFIRLIASMMSISPPSGQVTPAPIVQNEGQTC
jgi:hypothetical protein